MLKSTTETGVGAALWGAGEIDARSRFETVSQCEYLLLVLFANASAIDIADVGSLAEMRALLGEVP